jgi:S-adenosylmethionine synthetase
VQGDFLFTSESVTEGHPDKMADAISDGVLDAILKDDPDAHVACETMVTTGLALVAGEITTATYVDIPQIVRDTVKQIGYDDSDKGFDYKSCAVLTSIDKQSPDIAQGVNKADQGAGDQGMMFGFACDETESYMPAPIHYAHRLAERLAKVRKNQTLKFLRPDGKTQVTFQYEAGVPTRIDTIVIAAQHDPDVKIKQLWESIIEEVIRKTIPQTYIDKKTKIIINGTGKFILGGPHADCGLTGRKIIVDTYGGYARHGGGAFSGKDPSKVDRSGAYMARYVAKNIVASEMATQCEVQIAYAIGVAQPVSVLISTFGTERKPVEEIEKIVRNIFDFRPAEIINLFDLKRPIYASTSAYGHFGRGDFPWEQLDAVGTLDRDF